MPADWDEMERQAKEKRQIKLEKTQREKDIATDEKRLNETVRREIEALKNKGLEKEVAIPGGKRRGAMETSEILQHVEEGLRNFDEAKGELAAYLATVSDLRDSANALLEGIPGSSAAEEAAQILESLIGEIDSMAGKLGKSESKFTELQSYFGNIP